MPKKHITTQATLPPDLTERFNMMRRGAQTDLAVQVGLPPDSLVGHPEALNGVLDVMVKRMIKEGIVKVEPRPERVNHSRKLALNL